MVDGRAMGDPNAPVTIEVFEDFQCPACKSFSETIEPQVADAYIATGIVYYIFRHFPFLDDRAPRNESDQAASASMCAGDENRFWDYHDLLFANWDGENQGAFNNKRLVAFAEALGLEMAAFNSCFDGKLHEEEINAEFLLGRDSGVTGTPAVLVNGRILTPGFVPSFEQISDAVEAELTASGN
jgi:protein-disulfide isomerase